MDLSADTPLALRLSGIRTPAGLSRSKGSPAVQIQHPLTAGLPLEQCSRWPKSADERARDRTSWERDSMRVLRRFLAGQA
jgi:hypothetical protein